MLQIIAVHMVGGERHEHIAEVQYRQLPNGPIQRASRAEMVAYVDGNPPGEVVVHHGGRTVGVMSVHEPYVSYIRTHADGYFNDNLLALPRY